MLTDKKRAHLRKEFDLLGVDKVRTGSIQLAANIQARELLDGRKTFGLCCFLQPNMQSNLRSNRISITDSLPNPFDRSGILGWPNELRGDQCPLCEAMFENWETQGGYIGSHLDLKGEVDVWLAEHGSAVERTVGHHPSVHDMASSHRDTMELQPTR